MQTITTTSPFEAAGHIRRGGVVAFPTETVYGLGANAFDENAVGKIFGAKRRPADNPLIVHIGERTQIYDLAADVPEAAAELIEKFFPGPLTVVLKKKDTVPSIVSAGLETIGIRMPANPLTSEFLRACGVPVAAPSANISGRPSPTDWQAVLEDLDGRIDCVLKGEPTRFGIESTVVDCSKAVPEVLRFGAVSVEDLRIAVPTIRIHEPDPDDAPASPGLRHRHYSPTAKVILLTRETEIEDPSESAYIGLSRPDHVSGKMLVCSSVDEYARNLFAFFRECDRAGLKRIYCEEVPETHLGAALMDRLRRAAAK